MNSKKTFPTVALIAILMISLTPTSAFALTGEEELIEGLSNEVFPGAQPVTPSIVKSPSDISNPGLELSLLMDSSGSVDAGEFALQKGGYVSAFKNPAVQAAIAFGCPDQTAKGISVNFIYWSGAAEQSEAVAFTFLDDAASATAFADAIDATLRPFTGQTAPGSALNFAVPLFANNGDRQVIDVSGDGVQNQGDDTATARDNALAGVVEVINGIVISPNTALVDFYEDILTGPDPGSFVSVADDFADFDNAIRDKILLEICPPDFDVGGESLNINSASLMVAGIYANALWILPALAGIAGAGVFVVRSRMNKD